jgi:hypothetical protein
VQAIAGGLNSPALAARLTEAEVELARMQRQAKPPKRAAVTRLVPRIGEEYRRLVHLYLDPYVRSLYTHSVARDPARRGWAQHCTGLDVIDGPMPRAHDLPT